MKLIVEKDKLNDNPENILRRAGYGYIYSRATEHGSYVRRLTRDHYPRLHLYLEQAGDRVIFDLHLDQKQTSYQGARAHNAEHNGTIVSEEMERLRGLAGGEISAMGVKRNSDYVKGGQVNHRSDNPRIVTTVIDRAEDRLGQGSWEAIEAPVKKKWWKIF